MAGETLAEIPQDLRELADFPVYDTTFTDGPKFRQQLSHWSTKTDKVDSERGGCERRVLASRAVADPRRAS